MALYGQGLYGQGPYKGLSSTETLTASPVRGQRPLTVNFTTTLDSEDGVTGYLWSFGDGGTSVEQNPTHIYYNVGIFTVTLVYDYDGVSVTSSYTFEIDVYDEGYVIHHTNKCFSLGLKGII